MFLAGSVLAASDLEWKQKKSKHFIVYYLDTDSRFASEVAHEAEQQYSRITKDLGFTRYDDYWTWDKRVSVFLYRTRGEFSRNTGAPEWAGGKAEYKSRKISTYSSNKGFLNSTLPHEMTHLIFREFMGFTDHAPLWLDEGVAEWEENRNYDELSGILSRLVREKRIMPLEELTEMDVRKVKEISRAAEFYAQAAALVGYLITEQGASSFRKFCGQLRDGKSFDDALRFTYPTRIRNMKELETVWKKYLQKKYKKTRVKVKE